MTQDEYVENLQRKFERNFEIEKDITLLGETIDLQARFCNISGRTFITQNDIIDKCENHEYCFIKKFDTITEQEIGDFGQFLKEAVGNMVNPSINHMSTYITGVIVANHVESNGRKAVENYHYNKAFRFYLHGWCDVRYICVDLGRREVFTNKAGKRVDKVYMLAP